MLAAAPEFSLERRAYGWCGLFRAMASPCEVHVPAVARGKAERVVAAVQGEAQRIETKFSRYRQDNVVARINAAGGQPVIVDAETARLLDYAAELFTLSEGRFDITSGVLRRVWTFDGSANVPDPAAIEALLPSIGWLRVDWRSPVLRMPDGMQIDFGGIGKEYAVDCAAAILREEVDAGMINFGGDLISIGPPSNLPGQAWTVGIESLSGRGAATRISLATGALATSGDAHRFVLRDGKRFGHILDARTGWPVEQAPRSVTVLATSCTQAGMLATFAMLLGAAAEAFLEAQNVKFWVLR